MKHSALVKSEHQQNNQTQLLPGDASFDSQSFVDNRESTAHMRQLKTAMENAPQVSAHRQLGEQIHNSPHKIAQRQQLAKINDAPIQWVDSENGRAQNQFKPVRQNKDGALLQEKSSSTRPLASKTETGNKDKSTVNTESFTGIVQMAGHAGVMIFSSNGRLFKRVESNEAGQFARIMGEQNDEDAEISGPALSSFPRIYRVEENFDGDVKGLITENYNVVGKAESKWINAHKDGDSYVEMESLGGAGIDVLDFKIGTVTAHAPELMANYGKTEKQASDKIKKMGTVDKYSETAEFGLRDSDNLKNNKWNAVKRWQGNFKATLTDIDARLEKSGPYPDNAQVFKDLENIHAYLSASDVVYIASSLVMKWSADRTKRNEDRIVLIDLAHPVPSDMEGFEKIKEGMLLGILNLHAMLGGEARSTDWDGFEED